MATAWVERRLAATLATDVVGCSHLVEQDEASTLAALKTLRREVIHPLLVEGHGRGHILRARPRDVVSTLSRETLSQVLDKDAEVVFYCYGKF